MYQWTDYFKTWNEENCISIKTIVYRIIQLTLFPLLQVAGRLHVQVSRIAGSMPDRTTDTSSENGLETRSNFDYLDDEGMCVGNHLVCEVRRTIFLICVM